ncbi:hypothetical protein PACTADRAFT_17898 [Pachysolen tannophilus NRRL Y-2460]|uniref:Cx9C motif-containing protein 4, mitochondrial n=1 Tax=Pachysolen tannophilus NRRL Y-2460 TaxID=669874 RepID=A0A1E4TQW8_PACTA|nr:hypothetical protein PACTADRAFT_17898 [Pachysolen tannophilus NRRL Y-2460]
MSDPCKSEACAIQDCLKQNNYNESRCTVLIDQLYACCSKFYDAHPDVTSTTCCPKLNLLNIKMKQRLQEKVDAEMIAHRSS